MPSAVVIINRTTPPIVYTYRNVSEIEKKTQTFLNVFFIFFWNNLISAAVVAYTYSGFNDPAS